MIGGIGSILLVLTVVPNVGIVLSIVGLILLLIALRYISRSVNQPSIFQNAIYAVVIGIIGGVVTGVIGGVTLFSVAGIGFEDTFDFAALLTRVLLIIVLAWIFAVASSFFLRKAFNQTGDVLGIKLFRTAGLLLLLGALLTIVLVGFIVTLVAYILAAVAFFQIQEAGRFPPPPPPPPP